MGDSDRFQGRRVAGWHSWPGGGIVAGEIGSVLRGGRRMNSSGGRSLLLKLF